MIHAIDVVVIAPPTRIRDEAWWITAQKIDLPPPWGHVCAVLQPQAHLANVLSGRNAARLIFACIVVLANRRVHGVGNDHRIGRSDLCQAPQ